MSKSTRQSLAILGVIHGGVKAARDCFSHGPQIDDMMQRAAEAVQAVTIWWPITGDELEHWSWAESKLAAWEKVLEGKEQRWSIVANISVSMALLDDLAHKVTGEKKNRLESLFGPLLEVHDFVSPKWNRFDDYVFADECVGDLKKILEFK